MDPWTRLRAHLEGLTASSVALPAGGRLGAALCLLRDVGGGDLEVVYTRRRDDLRSHPGQISFPGGRVDPGETVEQAAVREAMEEVALDPGTVEVLGRLPVLYIPPSRFWLQPVVARWWSPHSLVPAETEVAEVLHVRVSTLCDRDVWRVVRLSTSGWSWAWQLDASHLLWGATGMITAALLDVLVPDWRGGRRPEELAATRESSPWATGDRDVPRAGPPRLPGLPERVIDDVTVLAGTGAVAPASARVGGTAMRAAGAAGADAVSRLLDSIGPESNVLVLAGAGGNGRAGLVAARLLAAGGVGVDVVVTRWTAAAEELAGIDLGARVQPYTGVLPDTDAVLDALVGGGLRGPLQGTALEMALALRHHIVPVVSLDLPSGLHPDEGLVGDILPADVTVALGSPRPGLFHAGLGPFVGDLYVAALDGPGPPLVRLVPGRRRMREGISARGTRWRE
jgi:hydroxyethylthiazole kinase-like uncharacterized protein yjeF